MVTPLFYFIEDHSRVYNCASWDPFFSNCSIVGLLKKLSFLDAGWRTGCMPCQPRVPDNPIPLPKVNSTNPEWQPRWHQPPVDWRRGTLWETGVLFDCRIQRGYGDHYLACIALFVCGESSACDMASWWKDISEAFQTPNVCHRQYW